MKISKNIKISKSKCEFKKENENFKSKMKISKMKF